MKLDLGSDKQSHLILDVKVLTIIKIVGIILLMLGALTLLGKIMPVIMLVLISLILAAALNPIVCKISSWLKLFKIKNRTLATSIAFFLVIVFLISFLIAVLLPLVSQVSQFLSDLPSLVENFQKQDTWIAGQIREYDLEDKITDFTNNIANYFTENLQDVVGLIKSLLSLVFSFIIVLFLVFMFLINGAKFTQTVKTFLPARLFKRFGQLIQEMSHVIVGYVNGQILIASIGGLFSFLIMKALGIPNALPLAAIAAFFTLIPLVGVYIGSAIVIGLTLLENANLALIMIIWYVIYQQIENITIQPWIQGQKTNLSTLQVFIVSLIGVYLAGIPGALLSIPVAACSKIILMDYLKFHREEIINLLWHSGTTKSQSPKVDKT